MDSQEDKSTKQGGFFKPADVLLKTSPKKHTIRTKYSVGFVYFEKSPHPFFIVHRCFHPIFTQFFLLFVQLYRKQKRYTQIATNRTWK